MWNPWDQHHATYSVPGNAFSRFRYNEAPYPPKHKPRHPDSTTNHLEERLLHQAQVRASYTPLFWCHLCSIPQGMILDVQPLVKSLFCPIRPSPNGFFDSEASIP